MKKQITIKQIFNDNFEEFWEKNKNKYPENMREHIFIEVMKMIGCGNIALGFVAYICIDDAWLQGNWIFGSSARVVRHLNRTHFLLHYFQIYFPKIE